MLNYADSEHLALYLQRQLHVSATVLVAALVRRGDAMARKPFKLLVIAFALAALPSSRLDFAISCSRSRPRYPPCTSTWRIGHGCTTRAAMQWGQAEALEAAEALSQRLSTASERKNWLQGLREGTTDWEEVKLGLALLWEKAAKEGRDGGPFGYPMALTRLMEGIYDDPNGDEMLVADIEARLTQVPSGDPGDPELWKRSVASCCFDELGFVSQGF